MSKYVPYAQIRKKYSVGPETVRNWAKRGQIRYKTIQNSTRKTWLYDINSIGEFIDSSTSETQSEVSKFADVIYVRVSSRKQSADLERQKQLLKTAYPDAEVISDIGSGLNQKRPGFTKLVRKICRGEVSRLVVTFRDRLLRFGYELFKQICDEHNTKIVVYGFNSGAGPSHHSEAHDESELKEDLLAVVNVFVARNNGKRAAYLRQQRKQQASTKLNTQSSTVSKSKAKTSSQQDDVSEQMELEYSE